MDGLVWTSSFGIRSLIRSITYNTSTRVISLGVVFMEDFRSDPNENYVAQECTLEQNSFYKTCWK